MNKGLLFVAAVLMLCNSVCSQGVSPDSYSVQHSDSCWYVTMNYRIDKMPKDDELILISQICCPDTCINDNARRFQGRRYAKRYIKKYGYKPDLMEDGTNSFTLAVPEDMVSDTLIGVTYSEYVTPDGVFGAFDTLEIVLPMPVALSCNPVKDAHSLADLMSLENPYINGMAAYEVLDGGSVHLPINPSQTVHFAMNSQHLSPDYYGNAATIDSLVTLLNSLASDNASNIESIQIVGFTSPDARDEIVPKLGYKRAAALCNHLQQRTNLPDSVFEVADGGKHWHIIYAGLSNNGEDGDSLVKKLLSLKSNKERIAMLRNYNGGKHYTALCNDTNAVNYRGACCTRVYYHNLSDSSTHELNKVVAELSNNPHPDYDALRERLRPYDNDARALNIKGVIEHRQHRRAAAAEAFRRAVELGDMQASRNMGILGLSME